MFSAKVKYPYRKDWEKDLGYGLSAPITFVNDEIGEYKQYVNATDPQKQWVRELKKGDQVHLEANSNGSGYIVRRISEEVPEISSTQNEVEQVKNSAKILGQCIKEIEAQLQEAQTQFTSEDVRCLAISMFIQLMRGKKVSFDYSVN